MSSGIKKHLQRKLNAEKYLPLKRSIKLEGPDGQDDLLRQLESVMRTWEKDRGGTMKEAIPDKIFSFGMFILPIPMAQHFL